MLAAQNSIINANINFFFVVRMRKMKMKYEIRSRRVIFDGQMVMCGFDMLISV